MSRKAFRVRVSGITQTVAAIEALARSAGDEMVNGTLVAAEMILTDVKQSRPGRGVPVDLGPLNQSGRVTPGGPRTPVKIVFGGAATPYALYQHERTDLRHRVGEARYIVRGVERFVAEGGPADMLRAAASRIKP